MKRKDHGLKFQNEKTVSKTVFRSLVCMSGEITT